MQEDKLDSQGARKRTAHLLRCWQEADGSWRYAVETVDGRALPRRGFPTQEALLTYLKTILPGSKSPEISTDL